MTLTRPPGSIFPVADATMSTVLHHAQISATHINRMMALAIARPIGDGGVSTTSSAAGRNASSSRRLCCGNGITACPAWAGIIASADLMETSLQPMQRGVASAGFDQRVMASILDQAAMINRNDTVRRPHRGEAVRDNQHRAAFCDLLHILLYDALAFVIEGAGRLIEDQDARVCDE